VRGMSTRPIAWAGSSRLPPGHGVCSRAPADGPVSGTSSARDLVAKCDRAAKGESSSGFTCNIGEPAFGDLRFAQDRRAPVLEAARDGPTLSGGRSVGEIPVSRATPPERRSLVRRTRNTLPREEGADEATSGRAFAGATPGKNVRPWCEKAPRTTRSPPTRGR
jgi:hypothetical protein